VNCEDVNPGNMHQHFADHVRAGTQPPLSNAQAARHVTEIMLAGMESSRLGQAINLKTRVDNE
jgi:predicted dehydrogenase